MVKNKEGISSGDLEFLHESICSNHSKNQYWISGWYTVFILI